MERAATDPGDKFYAKTVNEINNLEANLKPLLDKCLKHRVEGKKMLLDYASVCVPMMHDYRAQLEKDIEKNYQYNVEVTTRFNFTDRQDS